MLKQNTDRTTAGDAIPFSWRRDGPVLGFALLFPTLGTWLYFVAFAGRGAAMLWLYGICKTIQFALPVVWVVFVQRARLQFGLTSPKGAALGALSGMLIVAAMMVLYHGILRGSSLLRDTPQQVFQKISAVGINTPAAFLGMALFLSVVHSFLEEYYWRWFVFGQLRCAWPWTYAAVVASVGFALHHVIVLSSYLPPEHFWTVTLLFSAGVAAGGMIWAWLYERSGSLLGPWLSHLIVDAGLMWLGFDLCRELFA